MAAMAAPAEWVALAPEAGVLHVLSPDRAWGSPGLVQALQNASRLVAARFPDADPVVVGDLSSPGGGPLEGHKTHHEGRDADVGLFLGAGGQPEGGFVEVGPDRLDLDATWTLIQALLDHPDVRYLLLDQAHIDALRHWLSVERGMGSATLDAIFPAPGAPWGLTAVVRHAPDHSSHIHVHIGAEPES